MKDTAIPGHVLAAHNNPGPLRVLSSEEAALTKGLVLFSGLSPAISPLQTLLVRGTSQKEDRSQPGKAPEAPAHLAGFVEHLQSMCQAVLGVSKVSKDPCPPSRKIGRQDHRNTANYLLCLQVKSPRRGRRSEVAGRRQRRRRVDKGPRDAVLGRREGWVGFEQRLNRRLRHQREDRPTMVPEMLKSPGFLNVCPDSFENLTVVLSPPQEHIH